MKHMAKVGWIGLLPLCHPLRGWQAVACRPDSAEDVNVIFTLAGLFLIIADAKTVE